LDKSFAKLIYKDKKGYNKCALAETLTFALVGIPNNRVTPKSWPLTPYALFRRFQILNHQGSSAETNQSSKGILAYHVLLA